MLSVLDSEHQKSQNSGPLAPCALWPVDLKITHLDWNPEATLIHFQGQYLTLCELDYNILQGEIQNAPKTPTVLDTGEFCLVEDLTSARWYRGRVQNRKEDLFDVFLVDHGNVLSVGISHVSSCSNDLFNLPPKVVCGFLANVLLLQCCSHSVVEDYFSSLIGTNVMGYIQALLPHKILLLEAPDINSDLVRHGFGRYVDTDTFLLIVEMVTEVPLKQTIQSVPDLLIEKPRGQEFWLKPSGLRGYKDILSFCGARLSCGTHVKVRVTAAVSPGLFYCQVASADTELWEMSKKLAAVCEYKTKPCNQKTETENLGSLCAVKAKDGKWYRACAQFLPINSQVRVLLIDYGFFESVKVESVHRLPPDFCSAPIMAFPCSLNSLRGQDEAAKTQQLSFLKAGLLGGVLDVEISSFEEEQHLYSITVFGAEDTVKEQKAIQEHPRMKVGSETEEVSRQGGYLCNEAGMGEVFDKKILEVEEVLAQSDFVGYVVYVQNPNRFWIRTRKRCDEFEDMMTKIADHFRQVKLDEDILLNPKPGTLCCAVYEEDMHFYRGVVTNILQHGAEVLFIDFGNIEKVPQMLIKKIPEEFASKSAFAFCCSLNVFPVDEVWTSATTDLFRQAVSNKALLVRVVHKKKNKFVVDLYEMGRENSVSVSELLVSSKQAQHCNSPMKSVAQSKDHMFKKPGSSGCATSDMSTNAEHWKKRQGIWKNETEKAQAASFKALCIKPGCELAVRCSCISSPFDFWCQPLNKVPALQEMMEKVRQYYSTHTVPLQPGESCCVAKSPVDGRWYRAFITETNRGHATVLLIDYGFTARISEHNLQAIMPEYVNLEAHAFRCSLNGLIEPADLKNCGRWRTKAYYCLKDFIFCSTGGLTCKVFLQLNVINKGLYNAVDLYNSQTRQSVTEVLVKNGLARDAAVSVQLSTAFPESFVYCSYDLSPAKEEVVYVTHVSSQWEVYCHLERNSQVIEGLEKKISEEIEKMKQASMRAVVKKLCLAKYFDGKWYRGLAHPVQSPLHLSVFFVDYGNSNICEKTHVVFIPRDSVDLLCTPMQAVRCSLASVLKEELYTDAKKLLGEAVLNKQVRAIIVGKSEDGSFDVELFDGDVNINEKVNELIRSLSPKSVERFTASSTKSKPEGHSLNSPISHRGPQVRSPARKRKEHANVTNGHGRVHQTNTQAKQKQDKTKSCVSKTPQKHRSVKEQRELRDAIVNSGKPQHTQPTGIPHFSCLPHKKLAAGFRAKGFASHIESITSFYLQLSEDEPAILKMAEDLNSEVFRQSLKTATSLRIHDLVLAEYEADGALYRSVVKDVQTSSCLIAEFIDYGNSAAVEKKKIYPIPKNYVSQPRLSILCSLLDTSAHGKAPSSFTDAIMEKPLMVEFVRQCGSQWEVKVDILDAAVLPEAFEAGVERNAVTKNEVERPACSTKPSDEDEVESCDQPGNNQEDELCENEATKSEKMIPAAATQNTLKPPPVTLSAKLKLKTSRLSRKTRKRSKSSSKRKTSKSSVRVARVGTKALLPTAIPAEASDNGTVLSVQSNGRFHIRPAKTSDCFTALQRRIADNFHRCEMVAEDDVKPGLNCLAEVDDKWHRAVVQQAGFGTCHVLLVDHGMAVETSRDSLRRQCSGMEEIPNLAVLCKMAFSEGADAQELCEQTLKPMIGKEVQLVFVNYSEAENLWMVETVMNGLFPVRQIATSLKQNQDFTPCPAETQNEAREREPSMETGPPPRLAFAPVDRDESYFGLATAVTTPFEFCVVLEDLLLITKKVSIVLGDLPSSVSPLPDAHLTPGACCLFQSASENKWCRAEIVSADTSVVLNLVDHGECECMPLKDLSKLKSLPEELLNLPKVMYPCLLRGVKPVGPDGGWTDEAAAFFQQCLYQKTLQIFFRESVSNTHWKVDVVADGVHVAKDLVDAGHASYVDVMLELRFQEQNPPKASPQDLDGEKEPVRQDKGSAGTSGLLA